MGAASITNIVLDLVLIAGRRGRCHCHRYQPAGVLCALPALSDAGGGRQP